MSPVLHPCFRPIGDGGDLLGDGGDLLGDGGDLLGDGGKKCDLPTDQPTYLHLTWVGSRDACASKNGTAPHSMQQLHYTMWCTYDAVSANVLI